MKKLVLFYFLLLALSAFRPQKKLNIWLTGDSTMAWKKPERDPESGWGEALKNLVHETAIVHNHAASGRSSKSFVREKRWQTVLDSIQPGDYVVIQFGHMMKNLIRSCIQTPFTTYKEYLKKFVVEARSKGGIPIISTSIVRRHLNREGELVNTHGDYIEAARQAAKETKTICID